MERRREEANMMPVADVRLTDATVTADRASWKRAEEIVIRVAAQHGTLVQRGSPTQSDEQAVQVTKRTRDL